MKAIRLFLVFIFCMGFIRVNAQLNIKGKIKEQTTNRAENKVDEGIDKGLDSVEKGVKDLFKKKKKPAEGEQTEAEQTKEKPAETAKPESQEVKPASASPSLQAYSKFDFIPGEKVIFYDDFSQDKVGDFPALWFSNGSGEVVTLNNYPGNWLSFAASGAYYPDRNLLTTENFTVEFDMIFNFEEGASFGAGFYIVSGNIKDPGEGGAVPGKAGVKTVFSPLDIQLSGYENGAYTIAGEGANVIKSGEKVHYSYWIQKQRLRIYANEKKVVDAPRIIPAGYKFNMLRFELDDSKPFIANFRVAAGLPDTRNKLITEGKLVTYGIYFDVNKDVVKPESYGTLKEIAGVLNEVPDVKVKIFGHTDADGDDAKNMDLSKRRAASVKNELVKSFGVKADRLETDGLGESKPVAPNDTPANKALNRRVEFIKL
jgi:outer membrane protein OmpA-like peptidoglycan-associated protein